MYILILVTEEGIIARYKGFLFPLDLRAETRAPLCPLAKLNPQFSQKRVPASTTYPQFGQVLA